MTFTKYVVYCKLITPRFNFHNHRFDYNAHVTVAHLTLVYIHVPDIVYLKTF
jgi:hypothetical protein